MKRLDKKNFFAVILTVIAVTAACLTIKEAFAGPGGSAGSSISSGAAGSSQGGPPPFSSAPASAAPKVIDGFVRVTDIDSSLVIDLKYATTDNFTHQKVYPTNICVLRLGTAEKLARANAQFKSMGYRIKIWDAYRPVSVQKIFWSIEPDERFVANQATRGSNHNRGCAVAITLADADGREREMPSGFDDFTQKAYRSSPDMSPQARTDLDLLTRIMTQNGFLTLSTEWWHFEDSDRNRYQNADVDLSLFE